MKLRYLALVIFLNGCFYKNIDTFDEYCDHVHERNQTQQVTKFDKDLVKQDFVNMYNQVILFSIAKSELGATSPQDSVVQLLYEKGLIGVTQDGDILHIRNNFLLSESDPALSMMEVPPEKTFEGFTKNFEYILQNRFELELSDTQYCLFALIGAFYEKIIIYGNSKDGYVEINNELF